MSFAAPHHPNFARYWAPAAIAAVLVATLLNAQDQSDRPSASADRVDFARDIQPVFERSCLQCHGPKAQMGSLRLDSAKLAAKSIVARNARESTLYQRIAGIGDQARMPMGGKPLTDTEIALVAKWIDQGAVWPEALTSKNAEIRKHWAFTPPVRPALPNLPGATKSSSPVDLFIRAKLQQMGLAPSPRASKITLLRRLSLDLIGLPPTPEEVDAFVADASPAAYAKQVDRLLASPHYGERWGRLWLDGARYADSDGFEKDKSRQVWFYRDWVIDAINRDMPYDRFVIEQIAGDLLPGATQSQRVATGFLRNSMINEEGGIDPEQFRMEAMYDRMDAIGKNVLGVTVQCAQCHNHKYEPISHEEYYRLFAFVNNTHEGSIPVYTPEEEAKRQSVLARVAEAEKRNPRPKPAPDSVNWTVVRPEVDDISTGGQKYLPLEDGSLLAAGYAPTKHRVQLSVKTDQRDIRAVRLELMNHPDLPLGGPGRSIKGTGVLSDFEIEALPAGDPGAKPVKLKIASASADIELPEKRLDPVFDDKSGNKRVTGPIAMAIDGDQNTGWGHDAGPVLRNRPRVAVFNLAEPLANPSGMILRFYLRQNHGGWNSDDNQNNNLGRLRLSVTSDTNASAPAPEPLDDEIARLWREHPEGATQLVLQERPTSRATHILNRGDYLQPGKQVQPGVPKFLHSLPDGAPANRLTFAKWLVDRRSPTTARSLVNRVWQAYFGEGLVSTPEDLGTQSQPPSHPELLDWLAVDFMDNGWSLKHLHRLIVTSETYKQASVATPDLLSKDPMNRWLARAPRLRVDGEIIRDITLRASGLLNPRVGGPSVFPPAPAFLFEPPNSYGPKNWPEEKGADRYRRAIYTFRFRSVPYPMLHVFDTPNGDASCVRRVRSNTPLQALVTLNEPTFLEAAKALAVKTLASGGATDTSRLNYLFKRVLSRQPTPDEQTALLQFLAKQRQRLSEGWLSAPDLLMWKEQPEKLPPAITPGQAAAWTTLARAIFNLDEAITKE